MTVGVLVLAAGRASRFGSDKRLASLPDGGRVLDTVLDQIASSGLPLLLCLNEGDKALARDLERRNIRAHCCSRAGEGMGSTIAEGLAQISQWDGVLITLADMPWIKASTYKIITAQLEPGSICVPSYSNKRGHPVGFGKEFFTELAALSGDTGASGLLEKYNSRIRELPVDDSAIHRDIDTPSDLFPNVGA